MSSAEQEWADRIRARFPDREDLGKQGVYDRYFASRDLAWNDVSELFDLIEFELALPPGLLRPEDHLQQLFEPVPTQRPFRWLMYQLKSGDREFAIQEELERRMVARGTRNAWSRIETFGELVAAWCGKTPADAVGE